MRTHLSIHSDLNIPVTTLRTQYSKASGPGGQHVNKTSSRVSVWCPITALSEGPEHLRERLSRKLRPRLTKEGELLVSVDSYRSRFRNLEEAYQRIEKILSGALVVRTARKKTKPSKGAQKRRLKAKKEHSEKKQARNYRYRGD